ncbi:MAG: spore protease YyaC [Syntrophomonadaceae bacterium]|nr:spore protease YyaC [Syntrophomonadaceae bacterium]
MYSDPLCSSRIQRSLFNLFESLNSWNQEIIVLCIGTDRSTGDSLGPLVGTRLKELDVRGVEVYGTLSQPVHAINISDTIAQIQARKTNSTVIAIDACLGKAERIGYINVRPGSLCPGTALRKTLPSVGDLHISGIVNIGGYLEHLVLQNTRLNLVFAMADKIAHGIAGFSNLNLSRR